MITRFDYDLNKVVWVKVVTSLRYHHTIVKQKTSYIPSKNAYKRRQEETAMSELASNRVILTTNVTNLGLLKINFS